jgi:hypothetical protein
MLILMQNLNPRGQAVDLVSLEVRIALTQTRMIIMKGPGVGVLSGEWRMTRAVGKGSITAKSRRAVIATKILQTRKTLGIWALMGVVVDQEAARRMFHCTDRGREVAVVVIRD